MCLPLTIVCIHKSYQKVHCTINPSAGCEMRCILDDQAGFVQSERAKLCQD